MLTRVFVRHNYMPCFKRSLCSIREQIAAHYHMEQYGFTSAPSACADLEEGMIAAVTSSAFGDGSLSECEMHWIRGHFLSMNYDSKVIEEVLNSSDQNNTLNLISLMEKSKLAKIRKLLVYDAIRAASADGLHELEEKAIRNFATTLDLSCTEIDAIFQLVEDEETLKIRRISTLDLKGFDELCQKYR
mmetsp:Transcript_5625/g.8563  ORF Transcript_5625/g.8563 Transcript_5625/m.8563 type:complete len:188 (+) Transcript_5625:67-630(+)